MAGLQRRTLRLVARARGPMSAAGELMAQAIGTALDELFR